MSNSDELLKKISKLNKNKHLVHKAFDLREPEKIPTGSFSLDVALGGGWPLERTIVLWGKPGTTKSTLTLLAIANAQMKNKQCLYVDTERTFTNKWAQSYGVDTEELLVLKTSSVEDIVDYVQPIAGELDVIVIDSISSVNYIKYLEETDNSIGVQARSTKLLLAKLQHLAPQALVFALSQVTTKFSGMYASLGYTGGNALEHASSMVVKLNVDSKKEDILYEDSPSGDKSFPVYLGTDITWTLEKNKLTLPYQTGEYRYIHGVGIDNRPAILDFAQRLGVVNRVGSWWTIGENKIQGEEEVMNYFEQNPSEFEAIKNEVLKALGK